jgi:hypothetical protein
MKNKEALFQLWFAVTVGRILSWLAVGGFVAIWMHGRVPAGVYWWHIPAFIAALLFGIWSERLTHITYKESV